MSADYLRLKNVPSGVGFPLVTRQVKENLINFFNWGFINAGGFSNVNIGTSGTYSPVRDKSQLRLSTDARYSQGQVWEGFTNQWVWESGILDFTQPIKISGVYVNGTFQPISGVGTYAHKINYRDGQVIFNSPISTSSSVKCEFSYKWTKWVDAETPWFKQIINLSDRIDNNQFQSTSGNWNNLSQERLPLPAVGVKVNSRFTLQGRQIGGGHWVLQDIVFYVLTEDEDTRNQLKDLIMYQVDKTLIMYDYNARPPSVNYDGTLGSNPKTYADLVKEISIGNAYRTMYFESITGNDLGSINNRVFAASVRATMRVFADDIT